MSGVYLGPFMRVVEFSGWGTREERWSGAYGGWRGKSKKSNKMNIYCPGAGTDSDGHEWMNGVCNSNGVSLVYGNASASSKTCMYVQFGVLNSNVCSCGGSETTHGASSSLAASILEAGGTVCLSGEHSSCMKQQTQFNTFMADIGSSIRHRVVGNTRLSGTFSGDIDITTSASGSLVKGRGATALSYRNKDAIFAAERIGSGTVYAMADSQIFGLVKCGVNTHTANSGPLEVILGVRSV
jgi:hypothetical protein